MFAKKIFFCEDGRFVFLRLRKYKQVSFITGFLQKKIVLLIKRIQIYTTSGLILIMEQFKFMTVGKKKYLQLSSATYLLRIH